MSILCLNSGSSSLKFALYEMAQESLLAMGAVEKIGLSDGIFWVKKKEDIERKQKNFPDHQSAINEIFSSLKDTHFQAVGHRIVHGKDHYQPEKITPFLIQTLKQLIPFAPLHLPSEIKCIEIVAKNFSHLPQVACFDTAFHHHINPIARRFPLPKKYYKEGVRKYGFHGLSYEYVVSTLGKEANKKTIIAHLGNGASMAAIHRMKPIDTTMGLTPTGGLMMGTRSGDLDPGILFYLLREKKMSIEELEKICNEYSGLLGASEISSDMKTLLDNNTPEAKEAISLYCYIARKWIGALSSVLEGLELLVFTGGIGERAPEIRKAICSSLKYLGIEIDQKKNNSQKKIISSDSSRVSVQVIPTNEDLMIARHTYKVLQRV